MGDNKQTPMSALIVGGTGHIGSAITRELASHGWRVSVMTRGGARSRNLVDVDVDFVQGDGHLPADLLALAQGMDLIVDAAAPYPVYPSTPRDEADRAPVAFATARTRALVCACESAGAALIAIGSFVTHNLRGQRARTPLGRLRSRTIRRLHPYFAVKNAVQEELLAAARRGTRVGILNPTGCLGPWDLKPVGLCLVPMVANGTLPASTTDIVDFVDVRDVAIAVRKIYEKRLFGHPILLAGHSLPFGAYFSAIAKQAGRRPPRLAAPASLGVLALWTAERALAPLGKRPPWPSLSMFIVSECGAIQRSVEQNQLGVTPRPVSETVADALTWYRSIGHC